MENGKWKMENVQRRTRAAFLQFPFTIFHFPSSVRSVVFFLDGPEVIRHRLLRRPADAVLLDVVGRVLLGRRRDGRGADGALALDRLGLDVRRAEDAAAFDV